MTSGPSSSPGPPTCSPTKNDQRRSEHLEFRSAAPLQRTRAPANTAFARKNIRGTYTTPIRRRPPKIHLNQPFSLIPKFRPIFARNKAPACPVFDYLPPLPPITPYISTSALVGTFSPLFRTFSTLYRPYVNFGSSSSQPDRLGRSFFGLFGLIVSRSGNE